MSPAARPSLEAQPRAVSGIDFDRTHETRSAYPFSMGDLLLLGVFAVHLPFFIWRYRATRELRYAATSVTFGLLVATYALRVFLPETKVAGFALHVAVRRVALAAAALSLSLLAHRILFARRKPPAA